jgi:hypothetical protein
MSAWEFIGWLIAIPLATFTAFFMVALLITLYKMGVKRIRRAKSKERSMADHPAYTLRPHLSVVPDRE